MNRPDLEVRFDVKWHQMTCCNGRNESAVKYTLRANGVKGLSETTHTLVRESEKLERLESCRVVSVAKLNLLALRERQMKRDTVIIIIYEAD